MEDFTVVIVNYESRSRLGPLLDTLGDESHPIVVVDNASGDGSEAAASGRPNVSLIRNQSNRGFAAAANQGAAVAQTEWLVFVNPDARPETGFLERLVSGVGEEVALVAPLQTDTAGRPLAESGGYEPSLARFAVWAFLPGRLHGRRGPWLSSPFPTSDSDVDWVSGAILAARRTVFERLDGFDERFFMFQEDVDLGRRVRASGGRVLLRPSMQVVHEVGQSGESGRTGIRARSFVVAIGQEFQGPRRRILGLLLTVGFAWRSLLPGSRGAVARSALRPAVMLALGRG